MSVAPIDSTNPESEVEAMLRIRSDFLDPSLRPDYLKRISEILNKLSEMMRNGRPREDIYQLQKDSFQRLKSVEELFAKQNAVFERMTTVQRERFRSNEDKIQGTTPDWVKAQMADELLIGMGMFRAAGFANEKAEEGLQVFNDSLRLACEANPLMPAPFSAPLCLPILAQMAYDATPGSESFTKELKEAIPELPFVQRIQQDYDRAIQKMANTYERELGIPKDVTTQFGADLPKVATTAALAGAAGGVLRVARLTPRITTTAVRLLKEDTGSVSITSPFNKQPVAWKIAQQKYDARIAQEKLYFEQKLPKIPHFEKPPGYPEHLTKFYNDCEIHSFNMRNLGIEGNGSMRGDLLYQPMGKDVFILISMGPRSKVLWKRIGNKDLIRSDGLYAEDKLDQLLNKTLEVAKDKGFDRAIYGYNPQKHAVATALEKRSVNVIGQGTFSQGLSAKPLTAIQVEVPK